MRHRRSCAQRNIALLAIVGVGAIVGSHGSSDVSQLRVRSMASSIKMNKNSSECKQYTSNDSTHSVLGIPASSSSSSAASVAIVCPRGGAIDDDARRQSGSRGYDRGDRPPPRRSGYDIDDRDYRRSSEPPGRGPPDDRDRRSRMDTFDDRPNNRNRDPNGGERREYFDERDRTGRERNNSRDYQSTNRDPDEDDGKVKKKSLFSFKKDKSKSISDDESQDTSINKLGQTYNNPMGGGGTMPPPPPPPPPPMATDGSGIQINPAETERTPIHYMFPTAEAAAEERTSHDTMVPDDDFNIASTDDVNAPPDIPFLDVEEDDFPDRERRQRRRRRDSDEDFDKARVSARRDAVTTFMSTKRGAFQVRVGSMIVGAALGGFIGKSLLNDPVMMSVGISLLLLFTGFLRNDYGELSRALGLAFILTLKRTRSVRKDYPTLPHLKAMIRQSQRKPFPPVGDGESPWRYEPIYRDDPDFKMTYALLAMALVGSICGGNVPLLPAWMGGLIGAVAFASLAMGSNARGDLGRTMGMRVVGLVQVILAIQSDLRILGKSATVGGLIFDKMMIFDRKHRVKDKFVATFKWGYDKVSRTAQQVQEDMSDERPGPRDRPGPRRREDDMDDDRYGPRGRPGPGPRRRDD